MSDGARLLAQEIRGIRRRGGENLGRLLDLTDRLCDAVLTNDGPAVGTETHASETHYKQAVAFQADAERGEEAYEVGSAEPVDVVDVPMTRDQRLLAANTHMLLAIYFELRHQTGKI